MHFITEILRRIVRPSPMGSRERAGTPLSKFKRKDVRLKVPFCAAILMAAVASSAFANPARLRCEYLENPLGIDKASPQLSWVSDNTERDWEQSAYQILVARSQAELDAGKGVIWDSGKVNSGESVGIAYAGSALESQRRYYWKVRVWDNHGKISESRELALWEMGLLNRADWKAQWITWENPEAEADRASLRWIWVAGQNALEVTPKTIATFRTKIRIAEKPRDAALLIAARGNYVAEVNGHEVGHKRDWLAFDGYDITEHLVIGENTVEIKLTSLSPAFLWGSKRFKNISCSSRRLGEGYIGCWPGNALRHGRTLARQTRNGERVESGANSRRVRR